MATVLIRTKSISPTELSRLCGEETAMSEKRKYFAGRKKATGPSSTSSLNQVRVHIVDYLD